MDSAPRRCGSTSFITRPPPLAVPRVGPGAVPADRGGDPGVPGMPGPPELRGPIRGRTAESRPPALPGKGP